MRRTKLICSIGPASIGLVRELIDAGMDVARINFSHGEPGTWRATVSAVRAASAAAGRRVGIMADLPGPKVRLGRLREGEIRLETGGRFVLGAQATANDAQKASTTHPGLGGDLRAGDLLFLGDGAVELRVVSAGNEVVTEVVRGGTVRSGAGVNVPAERLSLPVLSQRDKDNARLALELGVDFMAQSFVRAAKDVRELRELLGQAAVPIVAKIETRPAVEARSQIAGVADALMVARGDLGVEIPLERVPFVQKELIRAARAACIPSIVATQMLESMTASPSPTRAEAGDVANAVFEGADAVLLSAETAIGKYPVQAAAMAALIAETAERQGKAYLAPAEPLRGETAAHALANAAVYAVWNDPKIAAIGCYTQSGLTARLLSAARPGVPVISFSSDEQVLRRLSLWHAVAPLHSEQPADTEATIGMMDRRLLEMDLLPAGSVVILVASIPVGRARTNLLKMHVLGEWTA